MDCSSDILVLLCAWSLKCILYLHTLAAKENAVIDVILEIADQSCHISSTSCHHRNWNSLPFCCIWRRRRRRKLSEFPLQKYLQKECIQLKKGKDFSVGEERIWMRSSRSSHRKNTFNWRRERIIQWGKNEMWMRRRKISDSYVAPRMNTDKGGCNSRSR